MTESGTYPPTRPPSSAPAPTTAVPGAGGGGGGVTSHDQLQNVRGNQHPHGILAHLGADATVPGSAGDVLALVADPDTGIVFATWQPGAGAVNDHGLLTGLTDDDHIIYAFRNHGHQLWDIQSVDDAITANTSAIANTETKVVGITLPANLLGVGTTLHFDAWATGTTTTAPGASHFRIRCGATTLTGTVVADDTMTPNTSITAQPIHLEADVTVRTVGATGTMIGHVLVEGESATTGFFQKVQVIQVSTSTITVDTTASRVLELTYQSGAATSTMTFYSASISLVAI